MQPTARPDRIAFGRGHLHRLRHDSRAEKGGYSARPLSQNSLPVSSSDTRVLNDRTLAEFSPHPPSFNMDFDLLDHRCGEVIRISPWFGASAGGGPNKAEVIKRMTQRKRLHQEPE